MVVNSGPMRKSDFSIAILMIRILLERIMPAELLDGKACAAALEFGLKERISKCKYTPHLAVVIIGDDPASHVYVRNKILSC